jgi:glyoxylase-like metal-dependent hydrolase (beta-lactamase superfamily II)
VAALGIIFSSGALAWTQTASVTADSPAKAASGATAPAPWFKVQTVADGVWRIYDEHGAGNAYVVTGKERALLIDTGTGASDLAECVRGITRLPLIVVNTHGHSDHVGGNFQFESAYVHADDLEMTVNAAGRKSHANRVQRVLAESSALEPLLLKEGADVDAKRLIPVRGGYVFDLGGRKLEVIETPGHTKGSVCLLDREHKLLFAGDTTNSLVWLFLKECLPLEAYLETLKGLQKRGSEYETVLPGHNEPLDAAFIGEQVGCVERVLSGACKGEPYAGHGNALLCSYKRAQVAFNPENLRAKQ